MLHLHYMKNNVKLINPQLETEQRQEECKKNELY